MVALYGHKWTAAHGDALNESGELTMAAQVWVRELIGVSVDQIAAWFRQPEKPDWPPSAPEFRKRCIEIANGGGKPVPTIDEVSRTLAMVKHERGSIASRYRHPLVLAIHCECTGFAFNEATIEQIKRHIKPVYERMTANGWQDWPDGAHEEQKPEITRKFVRNKGLARQQLSKIKSGLGS